MIWYRCYHINGIWNKFKSDSNSGYPHHNEIHCIGYWYMYPPIQINILLNRCKMDSNFPALEPILIEKKKITCWSISFYPDFHIYSWFFRLRMRQRYIYFYKMNKRNEVLTHATPFLANQPLHERSYFFWNYRLAIGMNNLEIVMMNSPNIWYGVLKKRGGEILLSESYHSNLLTIKKKTVYTKNIA